MACRLVLVSILWAVCFPLISVGLSSSPHLTFSAMRAVLAGMALLAIGAALRRPFPPSAAAWGWLTLVGLGSTTLAFLGMVHAAEFVGPGIATVIANTQPLLAAVLAHAFLGERLSNRGYTGLILGFLGIAIIAAPQLLSAGERSYAVGIAYIALTALGMTIGNVIMKRLAGGVDPIVAMGLQLLLGGAPLMFAALAIEDPTSIQWSLRFALVLTSLALLGTALPIWLWFSVLETMELSRANAYTFLVPLFGVGIGVVFFGEQLGWFATAGAGLAVLGTALAQATSKNMRSKTHLRDIRN